MAKEPRNSHGEMEQLRRRFEEFRSANPVRSRFPEALRVSAAELAKRCGLNATARALRLDPPSLRKWVEERGGLPQAKRVRAERGAVPPPAFVEFLAPAAGALTDCSVEVEAVQGGKLRLELKAVATTELANLIRAFVGH
jgi:transposase-like protein